MVMGANKGKEKKTSLNQANSGVFLGKGTQKVRNLSTTQSSHIQGSDETNT